MSRAEIWVYGGYVRSRGKKWEKTAENGEPQTKPNYERGGGGRGEEGGARKANYSSSYKKFK